MANELILYKKKSKIFLHKTCSRIMLPHQHLKEQTCWGLLESTLCGDRGRGAQGDLHIDPSNWAP